MKKINLILRKCKSLSRQLGRSSSYSSLRSQSAREDNHHHHDHNHRHHLWDHQVEGDDHHHHQQQHCETIYVGSTRKRYVISSKYLNHPLLNALIERSKQKHGGEDILVRCEVVLFDHLLWMLENSEPNLILDSLEELADLYVF
ncbi:hypothetical protein DITRI_Ditri02bG0159400 [Diplodiscus trichospermus]